MPAEKTPADPAAHDPRRGRLRAGPEKSTPSFLWPLAAIVVPVSWSMMRLRVKNPEVLPRTGPFILAPNHYSEIDPIVVALAVWKMGRAPRFMAKAGLFKNPVLGWILRKAGQIPVEREGSKRGQDPVSAAAQLVTSGQGVIVYPEGSLTRDPDMWPMRGKTGAVRIALTHGIPIYPIAHWGTQKVMARYSKKINFFPPKRIDLLLGEAVDLSAYADHALDSATLNAATAAVMDDITGLLERLRDEAAPAERWDPTKHNQKETGRFES